MALMPRLVNEAGEIHCGSGMRVVVIVVVVVVVAVVVVEVVEVVEVVVTAVVLW
jgi:hypothetical protein